MIEIKPNYNLQKPHISKLKEGPFKDRICYKISNGKNEGYFLFSINDSEQNFVYVSEYNWKYDLEFSNLKLLKNILYEITGKQFNNFKSLGGGNGHYSFELQT